MNGSPVVIRRKYAIYCCTFNINFQTLTLKKLSRHRVGKNNSNTFHNVNRTYEYCTCNKRIRRM